MTTENSTRSVQEIQADIKVIADEVRVFTHRIQALLRDLEAHLPTDAAEDEAFLWGGSPPSLAYELHGQLSHIASLTEDALEHLDAAASATEESILAEWLKQWVKVTADDDLAALQQSLWVLSERRLALGAESGERFLPEPTPERMRARVLDLARDIYRLETGGELAFDSDAAAGPSLPLGESN